VATGGAFYRRDFDRKLRLSVIPSEARDPFRVQQCGLRKGSLVAALLGMTEDEASVFTAPSRRAAHPLRLKQRRDLLAHPVGSTRRKIRHFSASVVAKSKTPASVSTIPCL
jgi:hypothetical protein